MGLYGARQLHYRLGAQFSVVCITPPAFSDFKFEVEALEGQERLAVASILNQEYTYLGQGGQSIAFGSADGEYVLKFVKQTSRRPLQWRDCLPGPTRGVPGLLRSWLSRSTGAGSWAINKARAITGLIWVQLAPSEEPLGCITVIDQRGQPPPGGSRPGALSCSKAG